MRTSEEIAGFEDVPLTVQVELDRRVMTLRELLQLDVDSVLKMSRSAGENLDMRIGEALVAFGEIVTSENTTALRITDFNSVAQA
jgi:flagellar motor switch protein FliN